MPTPRGTKAQVDRLGELKASIAILTAEADSLVRRLKEKGVGVYSGTLFDANIYASQRELVDWKGLAAEVGFTPEQRVRFTTEGTVITCKVTARLSRV